MPDKAHLDILLHLVNHRLSLPSKGNGSRNPFNAVWGIARIASWDSHIRSIYQKTFADIEFVGFISMSRHKPGLFWPSLSAHKV
jgi:hypothetical protein